jgi:hypothetical protein
VLTGPVQDRDPDINLYIGPSTEDEKTWDLIQLWLTQCLASHEACDERATLEFIPTRLLELNRTASALGGRTFWLVRTKQVMPNATYITLSHYWGTREWDEDQKLTRSSLQRLTECQPVDRLPKIFRDTFTIIERLSVQYLWIDRFCILQDSPED